MVRRRKTHDGSSSSGPTRSKKPQLKKKDASVKRWESRDDIPMDDEERFHADRDKILLEGDGAWDDDDLGGRDEVFALSGLDEGSSDDEGDDGGESEPPVSSTNSKLKKEPKVKPQASQSAPRTEESESEEDTWGRKQAAYYVDGREDDDEPLDDVDEEELERMEEEEARRLQRKLREEVDEEDYGFTALEDATQDEVSDPLEEKQPSSSSTSGKSKATLVRELERTSPESLALAWDFQAAAEDLVRVEQALVSKSPNDPALGLMHLHHQTLLTYTTVLAFYLHMRASPTYASRPELLASHPIMGRLLSLKTALAELQALGFSAIGSDDSDFDSEEEELDEEADEEMMDLLGRFGIGPEQIERVMRLGGGMSRRDAFELIMEAAMDSQPTKGPKVPPKISQSDTTAAGPSKKKKKKQGTNGKLKSTSPSPSPEPPAFDLVEPTFVSTKPKPSSSQRKATMARVMDDDFVEPTSLGSADAADKAARKRALQFHTSKIAKKTRTRDKAAHSMAGDDDIPYLEDPRTRMRRERDLQKEGWGAEGEGDPNAVQPPEGKMRVWGEGTSSFSAANGGEEKGKAAKRARDESDGDDDGLAAEYLELVKSNKRSKKAEKREAFEAEEEVKRQAYSEDPVLGPRAPSRNIVRNKGVARSRGKAVVNPRVKKRQQYDKAKKKLASQKAVYKGGLNAVGGSYEGEISGINSRVIKSVKFG